MSLHASELLDVFHFDGSGHPGRRRKLLAAAYVLRVVRTQVHGGRRIAGRCNNGRRAALRPWRRVFCAWRRRRAASSSSSSSAWRRLEVAAVGEPKVARGLPCLELLAVVAKRFEALLFAAPAADLEEDVESFRPGADERKSESKSEIESKIRAETESNARQNKSAEFFLFKECVGREGERARTCAAIFRHRRFRSRPAATG